MNARAGCTLLRAVLVAGVGSGPWALGVGAESQPFQVNPVPIGAQYVAAVAATPNHGFVVVWTSLGQDGSCAGVCARWYNRQAVPLGDVVQVNPTFNAQIVQGVATDAAGHAVIVWLSPAQDGSGLGVFARRFDVGGTPLGDELQVNTFTQGDQVNASVAMAGAGQFVVAWSGPLAGGGWGISARRFGSDGVPLGDEFLVDVPTSSVGHWATSVATTGGFAFVAAWDAADMVFARRYDAAGTASGPSFLVSTVPEPPDYYADNLGGVAADGAGAFVVAWARPDSIETVAHHACRYAADGTLQWCVVTCVYAGEQGLAVAAGGGFVNADININGTGLGARRFDIDGNLLHSDTILYDPHASMWGPRLVHLSAFPQEWVMVWTDYHDAGWNVLGVLGPEWVFGDSFESGDPSAWASTTP